MLAFQLKNINFNGGFLASLDNTWSTGDPGLKCTNDESVNANDDWKYYEYDDSDWRAPEAIGQNGVKPWGERPLINKTAMWVWLGEGHDIFCRLPLTTPCQLPEILHGNWLPPCDKTPVVKDQYILQCEPGFMLSNGLHGVFLCNETGHLNYTSEPLCQAIRCQPPAIDNGHWSSPCDQRPVYNDSCQVKCELGFTLENVSNNNFICDENGEMNITETPICKAIDTTTVPITTSTIRTVFPVDSPVTFTCSKGHITRTDSETVLTCLESSLWKLPCPPPPKISRTSMKVDCLTEYASQKVTYRCLLGYIDKRRTELTKECLSTGKWSAGTMDCQRMKNASEFYVIKVPNDPPPSTSKEKMMATLEMKQVDMRRSNMMLGSGVGIFYISAFFILVIAMDAPTIRRELKRLKSNLCAAYRQWQGNSVQF